jgi:RNA polymerase sigma-70 factor, ECF subfamily
MDCFEPVQRDREVRSLDGTPPVRKRFVRPPLPDVDFSPVAGKARPLRAACASDGAVFAEHRARLLRIAYRILRSQAEAEDLVQDVYLRWHSARRDVETPIAFLVTITRRLCLDRLRELKRQRPECPTLGRPDGVEDHMVSPEMQLELNEEVSVGFLAVLERLGPDERCAFLLHDLFDYSYQEVGRIVSRTESACRQMIHRARARLRDSRARSEIRPECHERAFKTFLAAIRTDDCRAVMALLAEVRL